MSVKVVSLVKKMNSVRLAAHSKLCKGVNTYLSLCVNRLVTFSLYDTLGELQHVLPELKKMDGFRVCVAFKKSCLK